jgi:hypothetical protein
MHSMISKIDTIFKVKILTMPSLKFSMNMNTNLYRDVDLTMPGLLSIACCAAWYHHLLVELKLIEHNITFFGYKGNHFSNHNKFDN